MPIMMARVVAGTNPPIPENKGPTPTGTFTLKEWEEIIGRSVAAWEERKREYQRWLALGITSAVALTGVLVNKLPQVNLGGGPSLTGLLALLFSYIVAHAGFELMEGRMAHVLRVIVVGEKEKEGPRKNLRDLLHIAEVSPGRVMTSAVGQSAVITILLWSVVFLQVASTASNEIIQLAIWRTAFYAVFLVFLIWARGFARKLLPQKEALLASAPKEYSAEQLSHQAKGEAMWKAFLGLYYGVQLWLIGLGISHATTLTYDLAVTILVLVGIAGLTSVLREIVWPLLKRSSEVFAKLRDLHSSIVVGELGDAAGVHREIGKLMKEEEEQPSVWFAANSH